MTSSSSSPLAVRMLGIAKSYGTVQAVSGVSLAIPPGSITAVIGENGAGKTSLMKILAGVVRPDAGEIEVFGKDCDFASSRDAVRAGIGMVFQEGALLPSLTVWENIVLGWEPRGIGRYLSTTAALERVSALMAQHGLQIDPLARVADLPVSARQKVEILKILHREAKVIILDEPTSVLTPQERRGLFDAAFSLRAGGHSIIFISHKLPEVLEIADHIHVMRQGRVVADMKAEAADVDSLARLIVGRDLARTTAAAARHAGDVLLEVDAACVGSAALKRGIVDISLKVRRGRVVGLAGVSGSGQDELIGAITGHMALASGSVRFHGRDGHTVVVTPGSTGTTISALRAGGLGHVPADRNEEGSIPELPLWVSAIGGRQHMSPYSRGGFLDLAAARDAARRTIGEFAVRAQGSDARAGSLSGGNLQKFIVGRELTDRPILLVAEEPTHGVDIGSALELRRRMIMVAEAGGAVLVSSTDLDELLQMCDEIVVLFDGRAVAHFERDGLTEEELGAAMIGLRDGSVSGVVGGVA